ncbi:MAG: response regulator transcription factor [Campylobacteraceae bacterium]|nr:response regulator transcription factor [Campylobacteraceae bacterium]
MNELKNLKILYIDDEENIRVNAMEYLGFYCDYVYGAKDGIDGFEVYNKIKPDIIITDIKMPKLNGLEMVRKIRETDNSTRIIVATAFLETSYLLQAIELGLVKYLIKPITADKILPVLRTCLLDLKENSSIFRIDDNYAFDIFNKTLFCKQDQVSLTKKELLTLDLLVCNFNRAVKYSEFSNYVWDAQMSEDALRAIIKELRKKISKSSIKNVSGIGYQIGVDITK